MELEVNVGQGEKVVILAEIIFTGPGRYSGFERTIKEALEAGHNNASGVKVIDHHSFVEPPTGTPEQRAGFTRVR